MNFTVEDEYEGIDPLFGLPCIMVEISTDLLLEELASLPKEILEKLLAKQIERQNFEVCQSLVDFTQNK